MTKILILGGGFAAVAATEELLKANDPTLEITLISPNRDFTFFPALVPYVFGAIEEDEVHFDLAAKLSERKIRFIRSEVLSIDPNRRTVAVTGDDVEGFVHYDLVLAAVGRRLATERVPGFFENVHHILGLDAARRFKEAVGSFDKGSIVIGLCPGAFLPVPVCEAAVALARNFEDQVRDGRIRVTAVFPESLDDAFFGSALFRDIRGTFAHFGVNLVERFPVDRIDATELHAGTGGTIPFDLAMLIPPFRGQSPLHNADEAGTGGFIHVNDQMQVVGSPRTYAAGDIASVAGPRFGYQAIRQGKTAAANILAEAQGRPATAHYEHEIAWAINEKYTDPAYFHYGFWDESLDDYDEGLFFGMAKRVRERYGPIKGFGQPLS